MIEAFLLISGVPNPSRAHQQHWTCLQVPPKIADKYVNLLIVGESGLGKTTFIRNCFSDLLHEDFELSDASWGSMTDFKDSPSVLCTHLPAIEVPEALIRLRYSVQDVPGCASASSACKHS